VRGNSQNESGSGAPGSRHAKIDHAIGVRPFASSAGVRVEPWSRAAFTIGTPMRVVRAGLRGARQDRRSWSAAVSLGEYRAIGSGARIRNRHRAIPQ